MDRRNGSTAERSKPKLAGFQLWPCPSFLGDSDAQGVNTELGVTRVVYRDGRAPVSECGWILKGGLAKSRKLPKM